METGAVTLDDFVFGHDCGRPLNIRAVEGQIEGSVLLGLGFTCFEECVYDKDGRHLNPSFRDYRFPTALDMPNIKTSTIACSAFTADTQSGDRVFGRNYDFSATNTAIVYTNPGKGRHASYSTIDLSFLGLDKDKDVESLGQKILTLAAPYVPLDGVNDAGVACGIFMSYQGEGKGTPTDTQTDKPDLTSTTLLRLILDYADSVEDAVALAEQYDLHDSASSCFHYMVADSTGRSAVLEWVGADADHDADGSQRQLKVLWNDTDALSDSSDWQVVTNFIKAPGYYDGTAVEMKGLDRYEHLAAALRQTNGVVADKNAAMDLLASVGRRTWNNDDSNTNTIHSVVYDLTDRSVLWVGNEHYGEDGYTFEFQLGA